MPAEIAVRLAAPADAGFLVPENRPLTETVVLRKIANEEMFVATRQSRPAGFVRIGMLWSQFPFIELIVVPARAMRRIGLGTEMLQYLVDRYAGTTEYLYSSCVTGEQEPQEWHRSHGFEDCGYLAQINQDNQGEIFFRKSLR
jgi:L-amino acid N-acyltransferase YncA